MAARRTVQGRTAAINQNGTAQLCVQCHSQPRLASLARCAVCIQSAAEVDRQSRRTAETRVASKKSARGAAEARAEAEHQAALEKLGQLYMEFAASPEGVRFLEAQQSELTAPRNDHEYVNAALARDKEREVAANETTIVHHWVEWGRNYLSLTLRNDRDHAKAREVSAVLQRLLEAELRYHPDPHDKTRSADCAQKRAPKHEFGRTARSRKR
jgi:hypothetical protein